MTPETPPKPPNYLAANVVILVMLAGLHALFLVGSITAVLTKGNEAMALGDDAQVSSAREAGRRAGRSLARIAIPVWSALGLVVTPLAALGLYQRRRWARPLALGYWGASLVTCCVTPFSVYGLWSLTRPEVKSYLQ